ncbi:hypothetical protein [Desulfofundulus thermosubterraneus]|uniref:Uncharacterized protein n=1 Tax=Desulfofundulus thermosubterraneus DSM 16057 TaxID=1121432 RepID=A0A1M6AMP6_9FIRM|nr:hypothetical protein [Desulfofundulus thermosubterraneus]SHI37770.1 hypothetical protein SAMN02745219_00206 [Desulfofundulus thermosubterraneus DSM 16057]
MTKKKQEAGYSYLERPYNMFGETLPQALLALPVQDLPESIVMTMAVFALLGLPLEWKKITAVALLQTATNMVRLLPIAFGMHTVILTISLAIYTRMFTGVKLSKIFLAIVICFIVIFTVELISVKPLMTMSNLSYEQAVKNPLLRGLFSLPYEVALLMLALGKNYFNQRNRKQVSR